MSRISNNSGASIVVGGENHDGNLTITGLEPGDKYNLYIDCGERKIHHSLPATHDGVYTINDIYGWIKERTHQDLEPKEITISSRPTGIVPFDTPKEGQLCVHTSKTRSEVVPYVDRSARDVAKNAAFASMYGASPQTMRMQNMWSLGSGKPYIVPSKGDFHPGETLSGSSSGAVADLAAGYIRDRLTEDSFTSQILGVADDGITGSIYGIRETKKTQIVDGNKIIEV